MALICHYSTNLYVWIDDGDLRASTMSRYHLLAHLKCTCQQHLSLGLDIAY